jgi:hypothetical protein
MTGKLATKVLPNWPAAGSALAGAASADATGLRTGAEASNKSFHLPAPIRAPRARLDKSMNLRASAAHNSAGATVASPDTCASTAITFAVTMSWTTATVVMFPAVLPVATVLMINHNDDLSDLRRVGTGAYTQRSILANIERN